MAPSAPVPPRIAGFAGLTTASTSYFVMSPKTRVNVSTHSICVRTGESIDRDRGS